MKALLLRYWPTTLLALSCVLAGAWLAIEASLTPDRPESRQPPAAPSALPPLPREEDFTLPPPEHFQAMVDKPLFIKGRKPLPPADTDTETTGDTTKPAPKDPPKLQLTGVLEIPDMGTLVLLRSDDGKHHYRLKPGDSVEGWRLSEVTPEHVTLTNGPQKHTLKLIKPRPVTPRRKPGFKQRFPRTRQPSTASRKRNGS